VEGTKLGPVLPRTRFVGEGVAGAVREVGGNEDLLQLDQAHLAEAPGAISSPDRGPREGAILDLFGLRDTLVFHVAGTRVRARGGYMAASWDFRAPAAGPPGPPRREPLRPSPALNPDEAKAMESLAARQARRRLRRVELGKPLHGRRALGRAIRLYREALALDPRCPR